MKWAVYNLLFAAVYPFLLPSFLLRMFRRGGYAARMGDRFALYPEQIRIRLGSTDFRGARGPVWIHAVSVGEVQVAGQLMREWRKVEPDVRFVFTTTSSTGWKMALKEVRGAGDGEGDGDILLYNPLDFPNFVKSALKTIRPRAIVLTESEIWPNFILKANRMGIPLFLINARVSDRSAPRYRLARIFFRDVFGAFTRIFAQSDLDAQRIRAAMHSADGERVEVTGSFKFDVAHRNTDKERELRSWLGSFADNRLILLGGSTWPGEDQVLLDIYREMLKRFDSAVASPLLVIAPRHFEKADAIEGHIHDAGFKCVRRSRHDTVPAAESSNAYPPVFLADTTGELMGLYGIADLVFVGKSLCAHGSQNMIEPCLCGKPTWVGPFTENFRPVMSDLLASSAILQVRDAHELQAQLFEYAADVMKRDSLGKRASAAVESRVGVVGRCVDAIVRSLLTLALVWMVGCSDTSENAVATPREMFGPVRTALVYSALVEKPDAARVLVVGERTDDFAAEFEVAGLDVVTNLTAGSYDIILGEASTDFDALKRAGCMLSEDGVEVRYFDVRNMKMSDLAENWGRLPESSHLWLVGEFDWTLVTCARTRFVELSEILKLFERDASYATLAAAHLRGVDGVFSAYAGELSEAKGAFAAAKGEDGEVRPEYFLTREIPPLNWVVNGATDKDIADTIRHDIRSAQVVRRLVLEGVLHGFRGEMDAAVDCWTRAALRNSDDQLLRERLATMERNAKVALKLGNVSAAAKLFETLVLIEPRNAASLYNYAICLKRLGKGEVADIAFKRAAELMPKEQ